jgi:molybdopterin-guanine dinucleotide biosynthesis protein A
MIQRDTISGVILAGGQARRMQNAVGEPVEKGLLTLHGEPLAAWAQRYLAPRVGTVYVSANRCADAYGRYGQVVGDDPALGENLGPLAGLASVMAKASTPWLLSLPVDVPAPPVDLLERLAAKALEEDAPIAYAACGEDRHPLCMLVHCRTLGSLCDYLRSGGRKVRVWQEQNSAVRAGFPADEAAFFNINEPEDLARAEQLIPSPEV